MNDQKNLLLAVVLSVAILFGWNYFFPTHTPAPATTAQQTSDSAAGNVEATPPSHEVTQNQPENNAPNVLVSREDAIAATPRIEVTNDKLRGSISLKGARIDDLSLLEYKETTALDSEPVKLLSPSNTEDGYFAEFGWTSTDSSIILPDRNTLWAADKTKLTNDSPVTLTWTNPQNITFKIQITLDNRYLFNVTQSVRNGSGKAIKLYPYGLIHRLRDPKKGQQHFAILHEGMIGAIHGVLEEQTYKKLEEDGKSNFKQTKGWFGIGDKYWLTALIPSQGSDFDVNFSYTNRNDHHHFQTDFLGSAQSIAPDTTLSVTQHFFAGAKRLKVLEAYGASLNIPLFDRAVDFGWLYFITKPLFQLLHLFANWLGNFGLGILALTICIKLVLFPLANKSYVSMYKMKVLQPQMKELRERYKDDKMQLNKEMMELYKRENVHPMSGCLPMLIQIPIFFALYKVLFITIEMRQAPFYGWIHDLSIADPTNIFTLFGLLPWTPPSALHLGAWPVIMGFTMYLQQRIQPAPADAVQAKVMRMLPFIFMFVFSKFPAGLVIYYAWNNTLSVLQQWFITRKLPKATS